MKQLVQCNHDLVMDRKPCHFSLCSGIFSCFVVGSSTFERRLLRTNLTEEVLIAILVEHQLLDLCFALQPASP